MFELNDRNSTEVHLKYVFLNDFYCSLIKISLQFVSKGSIDNHLQHWCIHGIDKGFIDGHVISIMILPVQYKFSSLVHLLLLA